MPTAIANGKTFDFPDGTTPDQMSEAIDDYFSGQTIAQAAPAQQAAQLQAPAPQPAAPAIPSMPAAPQGAPAAPQLSTQQINQMLPIRATGMPAGMTLPPGVDPNIIAQGDAAIQNQNQQNQAMRNNPSFMSQIAQAKNEGMLPNFLKSMNATLNQFGTGAEDLIDKNLPNFIAQPLNYRFGGNLPYNSTAQQREEQRAAEMGTENNLQSARDIGAPISSTLGAAAPYIMSGSALNKGIDAIASAASPITKALIEKGLGSVAPAAAERFSNIPNIASDFKNNAAFLAKAPVVGAIEGGLNYNQTPLQGALQSTIGSVAGLRGPLSMISKVENLRDSDPGTQDLIKSMYKQGFSLTPGVVTGNTAMQKEEAGIANSDILGNYYNQTITRPNQRIMTRLAGDAIGLDAKNQDALSPADLNGHLNDLRSQYTNLESNTTGVIGSAQAKQMADALDNLKPIPNVANTSAADAQRYNQVLSVVQQIRAETNPISKPGAQTVYGFDGAKYQQLRQRIQDEANQAFSNNDSRLGNSLNQVKQALDDSLQNGMDKATASQWKDLNEKYAMTNLLLKNGLTPTGAVDKPGITAAVMNGPEAIRTLTDQGGRIQKLQQIAKYNDVLNNVEGGDLTGLGKADYKADRSLLKLPLRYKIPLYARTTGAYRLGNIPLIKPQYGISPTAGMQLGQGVAMTDPVDNIKRAATMSMNDLRNWLSGNQ